jgi:hypothetical protein
MTHNIGTRSIMGQEYDKTFVYNGKTYNDILNIQNFNHTLQDLKLFNSAADSMICITVVLYCSLLSFKLWYRLPKYCAVPPKHVGVNKRLYCCLC